MTNLRMRERIVATLEAFAVGDAMGMPTEFMSRGEIRDRFGFVDRMLDPALESRNHPDLKKAQVTDDTEQVLALLDEYRSRGRIDATDTALRLLRWMRESGAVEKRYIGPSSRAALDAVSRGEDPASTGTRGTTCGGVMRILAAGIFHLAMSRESKASIEPGLASAVVACCLPTHNTQPALEAAMGYAFALRAALDEGDNVSESTAGIDLVKAASRGALIGRRRAPGAMCAPSLAARLEHLASIMPRLPDPDDLLDFLFDVYGTGLEAIDVAAAAIGIASYCGDNAWLAIRMGASVGGDTDTIAALAGALCAARAGRHDIPAAIVAEVMSVNCLNVADYIDDFF